MAFVPTAFTNGQPMSWAGVATNTDAFLNWNRQVPEGDVNAGAIRREHLVRPVIDGFPVGGFVSTMQIGLERSYGLDVPIGSMPADWGSRRRRLSMIPAVNDGILETWRLPIGATLRLVREMTIEVLCSLEWEVRSDATAFYPNGAGGGDRGGFLAIHSHQRSTNTETADLRGLQHLYPQEPGFAEENHRQGMVALVRTFAAGVVDLSLCYHRGGAPVGVNQIDFSRIQMTIEGY